MRASLMVLLAACSWPATALAGDMAKPPPPAAGQDGMARPAPDPELIDPNAVKAAPPTGPGSHDGAGGGALTSGVCLQGGRSTGATTPKQCRAAGGSWQPGTDAPPH